MVFIPQDWGGAIVATHLDRQDRRSKTMNSKSKWMKNLDMKREVVQHLVVYERKHHHILRSSLDRISHKVILVVRQTDSNYHDVHGTFWDRE